MILKNLKNRDFLKMPNKFTLSKNSKCLVFFQVCLTSFKHLHLNLIKIALNPHFFLKKSHF